jgi:hypothetical protein
LRTTISPTKGTETMTSCCSTKTTERPNIIPKIKAYQPLIAMVLLSLVTATALSFAFATDWMCSFMGIFLINFSLVKFFDLSGFVEGFKKYDLLASKITAYGFAYPFIELILGLLFLMQKHLFFASTATVIVMGFVTIGVIHSIRLKTKLNCACMGNLLTVPLGIVTCIENVSMIAMSAYMLASY